MEGKSLLVRSLLTKRPFNKEAMFGTLRVVCKISKEAKVTVFDTNLFLLKFASTKDKYRVLNGFPWPLDKNLLAFKVYNGGLWLSKCVFG
ncbi:hypothetical protein CRYUN_Cryun22dG0000200 [Craigia yunnanensis]